MKSIQKYRNIKHSCIVKGDGKYMNCFWHPYWLKHRDEYMYKIHQTYPNTIGIKIKATQPKLIDLAISSHGKTEFH